MPEHPYRRAGPAAFWSRCVAENFEPASVPDGRSFDLDRGDRFMSAGSCFAANVRRYVEAAGLTYTVTEGPHPSFPQSAESAYYEAFSARYGNVYTARQMAQLLERALGLFAPAEDSWIVDEEWVDPYRPGLRHRARSHEEFHWLRHQHLEAVREAVACSSVFVFTLGLTEAWISATDGAVFPACPGTVAGEFDPLKHKFHNFTVEEVTRDLTRMVALARIINPRIKVILTVSPVPLVATATGRHVLVATTYSKSVLRVAADMVAHALPQVDYFPAYELVTGPQAQFDAFESDRRNVTESAVAQVMATFFATYFPSEPKPPSSVDGTGGTVPVPVMADRNGGEALATALAKAIEDLCEEEMAEF
jgi:hypothetical protein